MYQEMLFIGRRGGRSSGWVSAIRNPKSEIEGLDRAVRTGSCSDRGFYTCPTWWTEFLPARLSRETF
jgi:hypothetical protein